jgi:hypothetical protein
LFTLTFKVRRKEGKGGGKKRTKGGKERKREKERDREQEKRRQERRAKGREGEGRRGKGRKKNLTILDSQADTTQYIYFLRINST